MFDKLKTYFHILIFVIPFTICTFVISSHSYGMEATALGTALWNSYNIASEYYCARAGRNIVASNQLSTNINGVGGITDGTMSEAYGQVISSASSGAPINITNLLSLAKEVDTSKMSLSELNAMSLKIANAPWNTDGSIVMKNIAFGGVSLYFAVDSVGNWLGSSYDNIVAKFSDMTVSRATSIQDKATLRYPNNSIAGGYLPCMSFYTDGLMKNNGEFYLNTPVYFYTRYNNNHYTLSALYETSLGSFSDLFGYGGYSIYKSQTDTYESFPIEQILLTSTGTLNINGHQYTRGDVTFKYYNANGGLATVYTRLSHEFHSLQSGIEFFTNYSASSNVGCETEIVDTSGVPYLVDDLGDYATTIGDLYPVIEQLRDVISTVPSIDELTSVISDQIKSRITDLIDGIKAGGLTIGLPIDDSITGSDTITIPSFEGTVLPDDFAPFGWSPLFDTIKLPFEFSGLFQPLFYVFGSFAGLWAIWTFVPIAILILLFIWALK